MSPTSSARDIARANTGRRSSAKPEFSPPVDISSIKAFPYEFEPADKAAEARELITRVLTESLVHNRLDSPVRLALGEQRASGKIDDMLVQAENEIRKLN